jgi:hypothetical protein
LIEHGLDFVLDAVRRLDEHAGVEREARYAVVHLAIGAELLHKGRLFRQDWTQVFEKVNEATPAKLASGDFRSVGPEECIKRLGTVCGIQLGQHTKDVLNGLRNLRNKVVHFALSLPDGAARAQAAKVLAVLIDFIDQYGDIQAGSIEETHKNQILALLANLKDWIAERRKAIAPQVAARGEDVYPCPVCTEMALVVGETRRCLFCLSEVEPDEAAREHAENELGWSAYEGLKDGWDPFKRCPQCDQDTLVLVAPDGSARKCFSCGTLYEDDELANCVSCGEYFRPATEDDDVICPDCFSSKLADAD